MPIFAEPEVAFGGALFTFVTLVSIFSAFAWRAVKVTLTTFTTIDADNRKERDDMRAERTQDLDKLLSGLDRINDAFTAHTEAARELQATWRQSYAQLSNIISDMTQILRQISGTATTAQQTAERSLATVTDLQLRINAMTEQGVKLSPEDRQLLLELKTHIEQLAKTVNDVQASSGRTNSTTG